MAYENSESQLRRHIKRLIENGNINELKKITNLTPCCPYNDYGPLDVIFSCMDVHPELVYYFVNDRNLTSQNGLRRALECGHIEIARFLHSKGFQLTKCGEHEHVYNFPTMKLLHEEWGMVFDTWKSFKTIVFSWNGNDVIPRLEYLFQINNVTEISLTDFNILNFHQDDVLKFLLRFVHDPDLLSKIKDDCIQHKHIQSFHYLVIVKKLPLALKDYQTIASYPRSWNLHQELMEKLGIDLDDAFPYFFALQEDELCEFDDCFNFFQKKFKPKDFKRLLKKHDILAVALKNKNALRSIIKMNQKYKITLFEHHLSEFVDIMYDDAVEYGLPIDYEAIEKLIDCVHLSKNQEIKSRLVHAYITTLKRNLNYWDN